MKILRAHRERTGRWKRFPFYYTLQTLCELDMPAAREELRFAAKSCVRVLRKAEGGDVVEQRRRQIARAALEYAETA
jgi:hypothetical protein